nr:immunoglobulin heavy chain junction region [Mus musculus]
CARRGSYYSLFDVW